MPTSEIIARLQREILPLQGYTSSLHSTHLDVGLGPINQAFPSSVFPLGAVHEFFCSGAEDATASGGFIAGILSSLMQKGGTAIWIGASPIIFPPALKTFGINPDNVIFLTAKRDKEILWAIDEALKCGSLSAVIGEMAELTFTTSRRFQLAVEGSGVTSFLLRRNPRNLTTACLSRWHITSLSSEGKDDLPGMAYPRWKVELLKVRGGKPGVWQIEWRGGKFQPVYKTISIRRDLQRKTG